MTRHRKKLSEMNKEILRIIIDIKKEHPFWGYRRVWAYIRSRHGLIVNHKRIYRLMKMKHLLCPRNLKLKAKRTPLRSKPRASRPNQIWGTDMTKIMIQGAGWVYLHIVLDWYSKKIVGWSMTATSKTRDWIDALDMAVNKQFPNGIREQHQELSLVSDNGCQPTSKTYAKRCNSLCIKQIFTSYCNPKGNADTERVMRTIKEDLVYINEFCTRSEFKEAFAKWVHNYNTDYPHSAIKFKTPYQAERDFVNNNPKLNCA